MPPCERGSAGQHGRGPAAQTKPAFTEEHRMSITDDEPEILDPQAFEVGEPVLLVSAKDDVLATVRSLVKHAGGETRTVYRLRGENGQESWLS